MSVSYTHLDVYKRQGMFSVVLPEGDARQGRRRVGELDEEMVMESRVGDIIALGTSTWRIKAVSYTHLVGLVGAVLLHEHAEARNASRALLI